jgi:hypothetical protein
VAGRSWRWQQAGGLLLIGTVLPAAPVAVIIALVATTAEILSGHSETRMPYGFPLIGAALLLPLLVLAGYLIALSWTGTAWVTAMRAAGQPTDIETGFSAGRRSCRMLWAVYLAGAVCLLVIVAVAADVMSDDRLVRAVAICVGPMGLLAPVIVLAPARIYGHRARAAGTARAPDRATAISGLGLLVIVVLAYQLAVGVVLSSAVSSGGLTGTLTVALAFLLSTLLLAAAGQVTYARLYAEPAAEDG